MNADRKTQLWLSSAAGALLVGGILAAVNVLSHFVYTRLDLSRGHVYSVSAASKKILRALPDNILVNVYYSKELPSQVAVSRNYVRDLLKEYASASGGRVRTRFLEVGDDPKVRDEAVREGIAPVRFDIISKEKYEQQEGLLGLSLRYQDKKEVISFIQETAGLEYDLTSRIKLMSSASKPVLGFISGHQSLPFDKLDPGVQEKLRARYEVRPVDLASISVDSGVPAEIGTLFLIGPQDSIPAKEFSLLDRYLASGRSLGVLADSMRIDTRSFFAHDIDTGLAGWLKSHGIGLRSTIVFDAQAQMIRISVPQGPFMVSNVVRYPPLVIASDLNADHPVTKGLDGVTLPFVSPVELSGQTKADVLARSSKYSWAKPPTPGKNLMMNPFEFPAPASEDSKGPFNLAVAMEVPGSAGKAGRLLVVGTSKFLGGDIQVSEGNLNFFLNLVDWMSQDADLIAIRSKLVAFHPLREVPAYVKTIIRYLNMLLPPFMAVALGLWRWRVRRKRIARVRAEYAPHPHPLPSGERAG